MSLRSYSIFLFILLSLLSLRFYTFYRVIPDLVDGRGVTVTTSILNEPEITGKIQRFSVSVKTHRIFITTMKYPIYHYGETVRIKGNIKVSEKENRVFYSLSYPEIRRISREPNPIMLTSQLIRSRAIEIFTSVLSPTQAALLLGIVFGIKQDMSEEFLSILRDAGVIHVIAASGMNVSILAAALFFITGNFMKRRMALLVSVFGIMLYVFIAGFEASIVRAAILAGITFLAGIIGRQKSSIYALFLTAIIMLFINPSWLFDVGFQLSFLATIGILELKPVFDEILNRFKRLGNLRDDFNTTLAAQIMTVPVLLSNFGSVNLMSIVINLFVLWTIPILMIIGMISIVLGLIFTQFGQFIAVFAIPLLTYFEIVVIWFDRFKIPLSIEDSSWVLWLGYYLVLIAVVIVLRRRNRSH